MARVTGIRPLPTQHPRQLRPLLPCLPQVSDQRWPVVVRRRYNPPKIFESGELGKGNNICCEHRLNPRPCLLLQQGTPLPLRSLSAEGRCHMPAIEGVAWHKHVTLGAPGVGSVPFLQDNYCVLRVAVRKLKPEVGPVQIPSQSPLH